MFSACTFETPTAVWGRWCEARNPAETSISIFGLADSDVGHDRGNDAGEQSLLMSSSNPVCQSGICISSNFSLSDPKLDSIGPWKKLTSCILAWWPARRQSFRSGGRVYKNKRRRARKLTRRGNFRTVTIFVKQKDLLLDDDDLGFSIVKCLEQATGHIVAK